MDDLWLPILGRFGLLAAVATLFAVVLRWCAVPGGRPAAAVAGGLIAGILIGPMVLPAAAPGVHAALFVGESEAEAELERARRDHARELEVLARTGVSEEAIAEQRAGQREIEDRLAMEARLERSRRAHPPRVAASVLLAGVMVLAGAASRVPRWMRKQTPPREAEDADSPQPGREQGVVMAALCSVILAVLLTASLAAWAVGVETSRAVAIGGFAAAGSAFGHVPMRWIGVRGRSTGAVVFGSASLFFAIMVIALTLPQSQSGWIIAPAFGWVIGRSLATARPMGRRTRAWLRRGVVYVLVPTLVAWLVSQIDPRGFSLGGWVFVAASVVLAGGGHWIGAVLAIHAGGSDDLRDFATGWWFEAHARGVPMTQACAAAACVAAGVLDPVNAADAAIALGLLASAAATELSVPLVRRVFLWSDGYEGGDPS